MRAVAGSVRNGAVSGQVPVGAAAAAGATRQGRTWRLRSYCRPHGTRLTGSETSVSPSGPASCRPSAVNASMSSGASNARFRRPTVTCLRTPASTSRPIAWLVAWNDRPTRSDAVVVVSSGAPGRAWRSRSAAEPLAPGVLQRSHLLLEAPGILGGAPAGAREERDPAVDARMGFLGGGRALVARPGESGDVVAGPRCEDQRDRRQDARRESAPSQHQVDQRSSRAPVPVDERVDRLELRVGDGGLRDRGQGVVVAERGEVGQHLADQLLRRWHEGRRTRVVVAAADRAHRLKRGRRESATLRLTIVDGQEYLTSERPA